MQERGLTTQREYKVQTPGGEKSSRYVDVVGKDAEGNVVEMHQAGKQTQAGNPVAREKRALTLKMRLERGHSSILPTSRRSSHKWEGNFEYTCSRQT